jgi:signal transduction histidine kinase
MVSESLAGARRVADIVRGLGELTRDGTNPNAIAKVSDSISRVVRTQLAGNSRVSLNIAGNLLAQITPLQLDQALSHIVRNAGQAIGSEGHIWIKAWRSEGQVLVSVHDDGCGISEEHLNRVFEPFFTTRGVGKGVGLGLTIAWGVISRYGGSIDVESSVGQGSTFTVRLPAAARARPSVPESETTIPA